MATVNKFLHLGKAKADTLQLTEVDLVLDHIICCKILEIISNPMSSSLKNTISLRMQVFHAECIFMSLIQKRFFVAGLKDLVIEARLLEEESTILALPSPHHNDAVRIHKFVYEAFMQQKIQSFEEWLVEINYTSSHIPQFKESELLSELIRNPNNETLSSCFEEPQKEVFGLYIRFENEIKNKFEPTGSYQISCTPVQIWCKHCLTTSDHLGQVTGTCIYVPQKKCCYGSMSITIIFMLSILQITGALSSYRNATLGISTVFPQIKLLDNQLTKARRVKTVLLVAVHQRAQYKGRF